MCASVRKRGGDKSVIGSGGFKKASDRTGPLSTKIAWKDESEWRERWKGSSDTRLKGIGLFNFDLKFC